MNIDNEEPSSNASPLASSTEFEEDDHIVKSFLCTVIRAGCVLDLYNSMITILGPPVEDENYVEDAEKLISFVEGHRREGRDKCIGYLKDMINDEDSDPLDNISLVKISSMYDIVDNMLLLNINESLQKGAIQLAQEELQEIKRRTEVNSESSVSFYQQSLDERRATLGISAEEKFRLAQLVRGGIMDESVLNKINISLDEDKEAIELTERVPNFLRGLMRQKRINYRSLLPFQLLQKSQSQEHRAAILNRLKQNVQPVDQSRNSMRSLASAQEERNHLRMISRAKERLGGNQQEIADYQRNELLDQELGESVDLSSEAKSFLNSTHLSSSKDLIPPWAHSQFTSSFQNKRVSRETIRQQRFNLPVYAVHDQLLNYIDTHVITILVGETGSGKTTQVPQYLAKHGYAKKGLICCTQPRRIAAETLAKRVADEYGCRCGEEVGYTIRFRDVTSPLTIIKYMTDGMLLREALLDDLFERYSVIILDEAHERSINTDLLFGICLKAVHKRPSLKLIVTSATIEKEKFCQFFGTKDVFYIEGRVFPVSTYYLENPVEDYLDSALKTVCMIHLTEPPGDILVFLTGHEEIETGGERLFNWMKVLREQAPYPIPEIIILPLTATMPEELHQQVFDPTPPFKRKVVLATNVAETSITIPNLYYVVDSGFCKQNIFDGKMEIEQLKITPISQAQANQRKGRAGRVGPGKCYRLYTEYQFVNELDPATIPDIQRSNLFHVVLQLKAIGINDLLEFEFMDFPPRDVLISALLKLRQLEALDDDGLLTSLGGRMASLPLDPSQAKTLLTAVDMGCSEPVLTIVSMLTVQKKSIFFRPRNQQSEADMAHHMFHQPEGDQITLLTVYDAWIASGMSEAWSRSNFIKQRLLMEAHDTREQLRQMLHKRNSKISNYADGDLVAVRKSITAGFFFNSAKRMLKDIYVTLTERKEVYIHPSSSLISEPPKYVLFSEIQRTSKDYIREVMAIEPQWLVELAPTLFSKPTNSNLTREQRLERLAPILKPWETSTSWRISNQKTKRY